ncbi:MAG: hypothetical protein ACI8S6_003668 [Myxococcota bacterium]|jgi:hypothetical protein
MSSVFFVLLMGCSDYDLTSDVDSNFAEPDITIDTTSLYFGLLDLGETMAQTVTVTNQGNAALTLLHVPIQNLAGGTFTLATGGFPLILESEQSLDLLVTYTAGGTNDIGVLNVISNDPDTPDIAVDLRGGYQGPKLVVDPIAANFDEHMLGCAIEQDFTLTNIGSETLDLYGLWLTNDDFELTNALEVFDLDPGQSTVVEVTFNPDAGKLYESELVIDSNDPDGEFQAPLYGIGDDDGACQLLDLSFRVEYEIADVSFLIDNTNPRFTYLMESLMAREFGDIVEDLSESIDDITFGVAIYQDYNMSPYGGGTEFPFELKAQQTTNTARVLSALTDLTDGSWNSDEPASTMEALYQALSGQGYDQGCDRDYNDGEDVQPLRSSSSDPFGGTGGDTYSSAAGDGDLGGMGFREGALPIIIFVTDSTLRDPDAGHSSPGCSDAGTSDVELAKIALGARIIGVSMSAANKSAVDAISDISFSWEYHSGTIKETLINTVEDLVGDAIFDEVWLEIASDQYNMVDSVDPERWTMVSSGTNVDFSLTVNTALVDAPTEDTYTVTVDVRGRIDDEQWLLNSHDFYLLKPDAE